MSKGQLPHLRAAIYASPWAIVEDRLFAIAEVVERRVEGIYLTAEEIAARIGDKQHMGLLCYADESGKISAGPMVDGSAGAPAGSMIAVINVSGIIAQHASQVSNISGPGGTSTERVTSAFREAMSNPQVGAILFRVDSPGGSVYGVQALADEIYKARGKKPMVTQVDSEMSSAAYWIGSCADEIVMTPGAIAGSIGVYTVHQDVSKKAENEGIKFTLIKAGKYKAEGIGFQPLDEDAANGVQQRVDAYYADFVNGVAKNRGTEADDVVNGYGQGRALKDRDAMKAGLADRIDTLDGTIKRMSQKMRADKSKARAFTDLPAVSAVKSAMTIVVEDDNKFAEELVEQFNASIEFFSDGTFSFDEPKTFVTKAGDEAVYKPEGFDAAAGVVVMKLVEKKLAKPGEPTEEQRQEEQSAAEREAFRKRRHAHRSRFIAPVTE